MILATTPIRSTDATNSTTIEPPETTPEPRTEVSTTTTARTTSTTLATTKLTTWSTTPRLTATTKLPTTKYPTTARPVQFQCISDGYFGDPSNCEIYHACIENWESWVHHVMPCPRGLVYCEGRGIPSGYCGYPQDCPWIPCLNH